MTEGTDAKCRLANTWDTIYGYYYRSGNQSGNKVYG